MKKEHKSMNVDEEEMDEGKAKKGEPLAKRYGYADQQRVGVAPAQRQRPGGGIASTSSPAMMKSIESTHGSQLAKSFHIGGTCGICNRVSKSIEGSVCHDCQKSISISKWHNSHLG
tara:strand:- start:94 stop:441 length:348 start_codon:yes stop_codon:yes gene_type:complete